MTDTRLALIRSYHERGWQPVHLPARSKNPGFEGWQHFACTLDEIGRYFPPTRNVGMLLGKPSNGLVDVDLDSPEAISLARQFLPHTQMVHGRLGKPQSHWWYVCESHTPSQVQRFRDASGETICELRSTGGQTIVPPSLHDSGEVIEWASEGDPGIIDGRILEANVKQLAACALLARHWPSQGSRHDAALALSGALLRHGWDVQTVTAFVVAAARTAGDGELYDREECVRSTADSIRHGKSATGIPRLVEIIGKNVVDRMFDWLGVSEQVVPAQRWNIEEVRPVMPANEDGHPDAWRDIIKQTDVPVGDLPYWFGRMIQHVRPYTPMFGNDWPLMMSLPFWSALWPNVRIQNLNLAIWSLGISPQGIGKNIATDELLRVVRMASQGDSPPTIYTAGSPEGMWDALSGDARQLLCYHDEFGGFLKLLQRDHMQSAREALCSLYDGRVVGYLRSQKNGVEITNPHVVVAATTTTEAIKEFASRQDMVNGYLSRFMVCAPDPQNRLPLVFPQADDPDRRALVDDLVAHINRFNGVNKAIWQETGTTKDPAALDAYRMQLGMDTGESINLDDASDATAIPGGRLVARAKKIATLLEMGEHHPEISDRTAFAIRPEHLDTAITLIEHSRAYAERLRGWVGVSSDVDLSQRAARLLVSKGAMSQRDLCRFLRVNVRELKTAMELLEGSGDAHAMKSGKSLVWVAGSDADANV